MVNNATQPIQELLEIMIVIIVWGIIVIGIIVIVVVIVIGSSSSSITSHQIPNQIVLVSVFLLLLLYRSSLQVLKVGSVSETGAMRMTTLYHRR